MNGRSKVLLVVGALVLFAVAGALIESLHVTDEERVLLAYDAMREAVETEDGPALEGLLTADFSWSGPPPILRGTRDDVAPRFGEFWALAHGIGVLPRGERDVVVAGGIATLRTRQLVRFRLGDQFIAYTMSVVLTFDRVGESMQLAQIEVTQLKPGIL